MVFKLKKLFYISILILLAFNIFSFYNQDSLKSKEFILNFYVKETGEPIDGELFFNGSYIGKTENGKLTHSFENANVSLFEFKTEVNDEEFNFEYEFLPEYLDFNQLDFTVYQDSLTPRQINLIFHDKSTKCELNGKVYADDIFLGETDNGVFILTQKDYDSYFTFNTKMNIFGRTDSCFGKNSNLPFTGYWGIFRLQYSLDNNENVEFELDINSRWPVYHTEMQDFIRPEETQSYLSVLETKFDDDKWRSLDIIAESMRIYYMDDEVQFRELEYWQTPSEVLASKKGDCEDWAVTTLSLMRAFDSSIKCYNVLWPTHLSVLCYDRNRFVIYDQDETKFSTALVTKNTDNFLVKQENKILIRKMRNTYLKEFGLDPDESQMQALFNEEELITFENDEEFVTWATENTGNI